MGWGGEVGSEICGAFAIRAGLCYAGGRGGRTDGLSFAAPPLLSLSNPPPP